MVSEMSNTGNQLSSRFIGAPATKWLLIINIAIFFIDIAGVGETSWGRLTPYGAYTIAETFQHGELWRLISFQFLHANLAHLLFNMLAIFMFGGIVERFLGTKRYLAYYLLCGVAGALLYTLLAYVGWLGAGILVGASAGIFGILVALILIAPDMQVMLIFPPIPMKMSTFGMLILGVGVFTVLTSGPNAGGEAGHLGGALLGFVLMKNPWLLNWVDRLGSKQLRVAKANQNYQPKLRPRTEVNLNSSEIDRILDKVNQHGVHSLSEAERETLRKVSQ